MKQKYQTIRYVSTTNTKWSHCILTLEERHSLKYFNKLRLYRVAVANQVLASFLFLFSFIA